MSYDVPFIVHNLGSSVDGSMKIRMSEHLTHFLDYALVKNQMLHDWQTIFSILMKCLFLIHQWDLILAMQAGIVVIYDK